MTCHHNIEGHCPICVRVAARKLEPSGPLKLLHLEGDTGEPLCGSALSPSDRYSTLEAHDSSRFCGLCLMVYRAQKRFEEVARETAYRKRPRREKIANFNSKVFGQDDIYSLVPRMLFRCAFLFGLALFVGVTALLFGWTAGLVIGALYSFVVWNIGVSLS